MALKAFELRDGSHVLSAFVARTQQSVVIGELRVEMNGWRSQALLHTADTSGFAVDDLMPYATDRGYSKDAAQVQAMVRTVQASIPVRAAYSFPRQSWSLVLTRDTLTRDSIPDVSVLAAKMRTLRLSGNNLNIVPHASYNSGMWLEAGIGNYQSTLTRREMKDYLKSIGFTTINNSDIDRVVDLRGWVERELAGAGFPMVHFRFDGFVNGYAQNYAVPNTDTFYDGCARTGSTTIVGPMDWNGLRAVWRGPEMDGANLVVLDPHVYNNGYQMTGRMALRIGESKYSEITDATLKSKLGYIPLGDDRGYFKLYDTATPAQVKTVAGASAYPFTAIASNVILPASSFTPYTAEGYTRDDVKQNDKWRVALPFGFKEVLAPGCVTTIVGSEYPVVTIRPSMLGLTTTMEPLRSYLDVQRSNIALSTAERKKFQTALEKLETQADAMVRMTVATSDIPYPTVAMAQELMIVKDAAKGDVDMLNVDLGSDMTLLKAAQECEKRRLKGNTVFAIARIKDEAATRDDLISPTVLARVDVTSWKVKGVKVLDKWVITGTYGTGPAIPLSDIELAYLLSVGATWAVDSEMTDNHVAVDLAFGADFKAEMSTLALEALAEGRTGQSWLYPNIDRYALAHADFIGAEGYPIMGYTDPDELVRLVLIYKGLGDDPTNLLLSMFFANQLDLEIR